MARQRVAVIDHQHDSVRTVRAYMPDNYNATELDGRIVIVGTDFAGWTLDEYVIPRLASGLIFAVEIEGRDAAQLADRAIIRLAGEAEQDRRAWAQDAKA